MKTIGVCGFIKTGSSTVIRLLAEFCDVQVFDDMEFDVAYFPDGLSDLEHAVCNGHKYMASVVAVNRFRKLVDSYSSIKKKTKGKAIDITENFLNKIVQVRYKGHGNTDRVLRTPGKAKFVKRILIIAKILRINRLRRLLDRAFRYEMELSVNPENFNTAAKEYISDLLEAMGIDKKQTIVLDQPFEASNPVDSFKYFESPGAIIVDRDPRDLYIVVKKLLRKQGRGGQIPCDNVDEYIKYYRLVRQMPPDFKDRDDVLFVNYEELVYDYENAIKKISDFTGLKHHNNKGTYFDPIKTRDTTELFKKHTGFEADIKKIELELPKYLFDYDKYSPKICNS